MSCCLVKIIMNIWYACIYFQGDIQVLKIASTPDEAYELCVKYAPDCFSDETLVKTESGEIENNTRAGSTYIFVHLSLYV